MIYKIGIYQDRDKYLLYEKEVIDSLESLVSEILSIARMEETGYKLELKKTNISAILNSCCLSYI